jgi:hypothetical protein
MQVLYSSIVIVPLHSGATTVTLVVLLIYAKKNIIGRYEDSFFPGTNKVRTLTLLATLSLHGGRQTLLTTASSKCWEAFVNVVYCKCKRDLQQ